MHASSAEHGCAKLSQPCAFFAAVVFSLPPPPPSCDAHATKANDTTAVNHGERGRRFMAAILTRVALAAQLHDGLTRHGVAVERPRDAGQPSRHRAVLAERDHAGVGI